jgi:rod shape-determining protein MreD
VTRAFSTGLALLAALLLQTALTQVLPAYAQVFDPFLLVLVYCGLAGGETHGMLAGAVGGWIQDVLFAGRILGLSGLTKLLVGFAVGLAGSRFHLTEPAPRALVLLLAALADAALLAGLAAAFDVAVTPLTGPRLLARAAVNAVVGVACFGLFERQLTRWRRA